MPNFRVRASADYTTIVAASSAAVASQILGDALREASPAATTISIVHIGVHRLQDPTESADDTKLLYSIPNAAEALDISERTMWDLVGTAVIDSVKIGAARRVTRAALDAYILSLNAQEH